MSSGKIALGALAGVAIGSIIGILFAPEKGIRTRRKILDKSEDYVEDLKEKLRDYLDEMKNKYSHSLENAEELLSRETMTQKEVDKVIS
jgi:gas vesicle protein